MMVFRRFSYIADNKKIPPVAGLLKRPIDYLQNLQTEEERLHISRAHFLTETTIATIANHC